MRWGELRPGAVGVTSATRLLAACHVGLAFRPSPASRGERTASPARDSLSRFRLAPFATPCSSSEAPRTIEAFWILGRWSGGRKGQASAKIGMALNIAVMDAGGDERWIRWTGFLR